MSERKEAVNANVSEVGGAYYPVHLEWVPRVGELIDLWSFIDQASGHAPAHRYEVLQVVHKLHDVSEKGDGAQFVTVFVKPSTSTLFGGS